LARCVPETCRKGDARIGVVVHGDLQMRFSG
jgi:hypothetical protein